METKLIIQQVQWQDMKVRSELDIVREIARQEGWDDCEVFGHGEMITQPLESTGWSLIPADLYMDGIPAEGVRRVRRIVEAGIHIQGIIIADDTRRLEAPSISPKPRISLSVVRETARKALSFAGRGLATLGAVRTGLGRVLAGLGGALTRLGEMLVKLIKVVGMIALVSALGYWVISHAQTILFVGAVGMMLMGIIGSAAAGGTTTSRWEYDPKLVILVDDGNGDTAWVSVLTWYD